MAVFLILLTWTSWFAATWGIGITLAPLLVSRLRKQFRARAQVGIWIGFLTLVAFTVTLNFFIPMTGVVGQWAALGWIVIGVSLLVHWLFSERLRLRAALQSALTLRNLVPLVLVGLLSATAVVAAWFAAAEPMDYDAGLYRLGLLNYAAEYRAIPGLANLHSRFGFNSALGPLAAFMENGFWADNGFRIITGFVLLLLLVEVALRLFVPRKRTPGDFLIVLGWAFTVWVILDDSGRWISSPSQDLMALVTALVAFVFLVDFINPNTRQPWLASAALTAAAVSAAIRPLSWLLVFCLLLTIYLASMWLKPRKQIGLGTHLYLLPTLIAIFVLGAVMMIRDAIISGWLLFPFTAFPLPLDWRTVNPKEDSLWITWYSRAPSLNIDDAKLQGWFEPWLNSFVFGREMRFFALAVVASLIPIFWVAGRRAWRQSWPAISMSLFPALVVSVVWFVTAPDIRFGWAGLFALAGIPLAYLLAAQAYPNWLYQTAFFLFVVLGVTTNARDGHFEQRGREPSSYNLVILGREVSVFLGSPNSVRTVTGTLGDGTQVLYPSDGENCYMVFPLCLLPGTGSGIEKRGESITDGFRVIQ